MPARYENQSVWILGAISAKSRLHLILKGEGQVNLSADLGRCEILLQIV
jgi:hypothetical protein